MKAWIEIALKTTVYIMSGLCCCGCFTFSQTVEFDSLANNSDSFSAVDALSKSSDNCSYAWIKPGAELSNFCDEPDRNDWALVFEDNFNGPALDASKWISGYGWAEYGSEALYLEQNLSFEYPGELYIKIDPTNVMGKGVSWLGNTEQIQISSGVYENNYREWNCSSGAIRSKRHFMYGKFEIRCWMDEEDHNFPAFWLFGGPNYSEIDIFEFKAQWTNVATNMHHNPTKIGENSSCHGDYNPIFYGKWSGGWHTYKCEWDMWKIRFFVDGTPIRTVYRFMDQFFNPIMNVAHYDASYPFIQYNEAFPTAPMHLIANNAVDDNQGANVTGGRMKVDYIRVWSKNAAYDYLQLDNPNQVFLPDENHRYVPSTGGFDDLVHYVHEEETSNFADGHGGDLNGDGVDEFVSLRNLDGHIIIHSITKVGDKFRFTETGRYTGANPNSDWAGITCGDVDGDGLDEVVAVRNLDARIFIWDVNYDQTTETFSLVSKCSYSLASQYSDWKGIECGDFDFDGVDEFVLVRSLDQGVFFMEYAIGSNSIISVASFSGFSVTSNFVDVTAGDFNGDGRDEVALLRNLDGNLYILELDEFNQPFIRLSYTAPSVSSQWTSISAGQYKGLPHHQLVMHRDMDNLVTMVDAENAIVPVAYDYPCTVPVAIGSGFFNAECELFVMMNNFGDYELMSLPGYCNDPVGLLDDDFGDSGGVVLYPNPTSGVFKVRFNDSESGEIKGYTNDGKLVFEREFSNTSEIDLDIVEFDAGVYTFTIVTEYGTFSKRIIKQ